MAREKREKIKREKKEKTEIKRELKKLGFTLVGNYILKSDVTKFLVKSEKLNLLVEKLEDLKDEIESITRKEKTIITGYDYDSDGDYDKKFVAIVDYDSFQYFRGESSLTLDRRDGATRASVEDFFKFLKESYSKGLIKNVKQELWGIEYEISFKDVSCFIFGIITPDLGKIDYYEHVKAPGLLADKLVGLCEAGNVVLKDEDVKKLMKPDRDENYESPLLKIRQKTFKGRF